MFIWTIWCAPSTFGLNIHIQLVASQINFCQSQDIHMLLIVDRLNSLHILPLSFQHERHRP
jgi:hypothetical protein